MHGRGGEHLVTEHQYWGTNQSNSSTIKATELNLKNINSFPNYKVEESTT
jgi:hypothetical protein